MLPLRTIACTAAYSTPPPSSSLVVSMTACPVVWWRACRVEPLSAPLNRQDSNVYGSNFDPVSPWSRTCHNHYYVLLFLQINHCYFYFFQNAFFHSPQVDASLILVTELTATCEHCAASFPALHHSYTAVMESWEWKSYILQAMWGPD